MRILASIFIFIFASLSLAETGGGSKGKFSGFLYGGFALSSNQYVDAGTPSGFAGLAYGLGAEVHLNPKLSVGLDMLYETKGHTIETSAGQTKYSLSYVSFPVQLRWAPAPFIVFHGGPYLASLMVAATREGGGSTDSVKSGFNNDYGVTMGLWIGARAASVLQIGLDTRFDLGLADIQNDNVPSTYIRTRATLFLLTFIFGM